MPAHCNSLHLRFPTKVNNFNKTFSVSEEMSLKFIILIQAPNKQACQTTRCPRLKTSKLEIFVKEKAVKLCAKRLKI